MQNNNIKKASKENNYYYNTDLREYAKINRQAMPKSEAALWKYILSNKIMLGYTFLRQRPVLNYIADFMCFELLLIIEVDSISHDDETQYVYDKKRDVALTEIGFTVLRFSDWEVLNRINNVSQIIMSWIEDSIVK